MKTIVVLFLLNFIVYLNSLAQIPNYANLDYWAAHGAKWDNADSVPNALKNNSGKKVANVFFIHPTSYTEINAYQKSWNASLADSALNKSTDDRTILFQASCFNQYATVYAPRYRQAHLQAFFTNSYDAKNALDTAYSDIRNAFIYFLEHLNNDMPIIIASHSQGTRHAGKLLQEFFENKPLQKKLVAAYIIGMPIRKDYFTTLQPCTNATATGCFVGWRSYLENSFEDKFVQLEQPNSVFVTNPLTFTLDTIAVSRNKNEGSVLLNFSKILKNVSGTQVHNNVLWITKPKFNFSFMVKNKLTNYHIADINLFYVNIRNNIAERLKAFGVL